jgi:hypothetical protein
VAGEPSGWYADPTTRHVYRYWNGFEWTDQVSEIRMHRSFTAIIRIPSRVVSSSRRDSCQDRHSR